MRIIFALLLLFTTVAMAKTEIGAIYNLSGDQSPVDTASYRGAMLAAKQDNVDLIVKDTQTKPAKVKQAATALAKNKHIKIVIGLSANGLAAIVAQQLKHTAIYFLSSGATSPGLVLTFPKVIYLLAFADNDQAAAGAQFAVKQLKFHKAALVFDKDGPYSKSLASYFTLAFTHLGGTVTHVLSFPHDRIPPGFVRIINEWHTQFIYLAAGPTEIPHLIKALRDAGVKSTIMGGDSYTVSQLETLKPQQANNIYFSTHAYLSDKNPNPKVQQFIQDYQQMYGEKPNNVFAALGYDAVNLALKVLPHPPQGFNHIKHYHAVTGTLDYTHGRHIPVKPVTILGLHHGKVRLEGTFVPSYVPKAVKFDQP